MPYYLAIGVSWERFMDSCPNELKPFEKAQKLKREEKDYMVHAWFGNYGISAISVAVANVLLGKKSNAKYIKEPILQGLKNETELSEKELRIQRKLFVAKLEAMKTNFELQKKSSDKK